MQTLHPILPPSLPPLTHILAYAAPTNRLGFGRVLPPGAGVQRPSGLALLQGARATSGLPGVRLLTGHVELWLHASKHG